MAYKTLKEYMNGAEEVLNSIVPFSKMDTYETITVTIKIENCETEFVNHPWKAALGFSFLDTSLYKIYVDPKNTGNPIAISDMKFKSIEIVEDGLIIEVKGE